MRQYLSKIKMEWKTPKTTALFVVVNLSTDELQRVLCDEYSDKDTHL